MPTEPALHPPDCSPLVPPSGFAKLLAVVAPIAVLAGPLAYWGRPDPPAEVSPAAQAMERTVANDPDVILLGASKVYTDLDKELIAKGLSLPKDEVAALNVSGTMAPVWYAILKNRVYGTEKKPKLVVVYSTFDWTLAARPAGEAERAVLAAQMGPDEPVLRAKALGEGPGGATWERVRRRRTEAHGELMQLIRNAAVGVILAESGEEGPVAAGEALALPALESLFGMTAGLDLSHTRGAIPIVERGREAAKVSSDIDDTLLPDFLALAAENGTRIVFVHAPVRPSAEVSYQVEPTLHRAAVQAINDAGAGYLDLRELRLGDAAFGDAAHLNRVGRTTLTEALVARLGEIGAMGAGAMKAAPLPVVTKPPTLTRTGTPPGLPEVKPVRGPKACRWEAPVPELRPINDFALLVAGVGMVSPLVVLEDGAPLQPHAPREKFDDSCAGAFLHQERAVKFSPTGTDPEIVPTRTYTFALSDEAPMRTAAGFEAWWVYPGTTLSLAFDEATSGPGVVVDAVAFGDGKGAPTARVDGGAAVPLAGAGLHRSAVLPTPAGAAWTLDVASPADGPWVLLRRVVHGPADAPRFVVGAPGPSSVGVLASDATYSPEPHALPPLGAPTAAGDTTSTFALDPATVPNTETLWGLASVAGCSPVRLSEDGTPLAAPTVRPKDVDKGPGRYAQGGTTLTVIGSDGTAPHINGRAYAASLDATRKCRGLRWLYPGDTATITVKPNLLAPLLADATRLELGGAAVSAEPTEALGTLRVRTGGTTHLETTFRLADLASTPPAWTFNPPLPRGPDPVVFELSIPADAPFTLVTSLALSEPGALPTAPAAAAEATP